ncbi:hypothetical protein [Pseudomonas sp.]|uniref:hypothetical protein n=1 Tax=Pseudomonas sp. TaxID=306 RepID=UPI0027342834|nr:hypothetical protein [Pseudomonas sp.]MDP3817310.1 hypothetical protein [Pseudomonas sp.]
MFSLRALLAPARPLRSFALLDNHGLCRALRQSAKAPLGAGWVEVAQINPSWLQHPLPASARVAQVTAHAQTGKALAA